MKQEEENCFVSKLFLCGAASFLKTDVSLLAVDDAQKSVYSLVGYLEEA